MRKIDPQLEFLVENNVAALRPSESAGPVSMTETVGAALGVASHSVVVLVEFDGDPVVLEQVGLKIRSVSGDVVTGVIALDKIPKLSAIEHVRRLESTREMRSELDLSLVETKADLVHTGPPGRRGTGVIVGIVDSGIDFTHENFRKSDGTSRILLLWDQGLAPEGNEASPAGFNFGVEYSKAVIDAALKTPNPSAKIRHRDMQPMHGTHVAGIAAGDGSAPGEGKAAFSFVGVAPEADLIVVANRSSSTDVGIGTSSNTLDAVNYIYKRAELFSRPVVVNMSLGDNLGPHDGTSLLERGIDNLLGGEGRAFVKSGGNAGAADIHASGKVTATETLAVVFNSPLDNDTPDQIDLWYNGADEFRVSLVNPSGTATGEVGVGIAQTFQLASGNSVRIDHRNNDARNGDKRIFITITAGELNVIAAGNWTIRLLGLSCPGGGRFDAWIQRGEVVPRFLPPHVNSAATISTPGTARKIITAASYVTRGSGVGSLSSFSSRGPSRDGRAAPTIAAPGQAIISVNGLTNLPYQSMSGTSMATPHVTGAIALMLQKDRNLTQTQIIDCLTRTARADTQTGPVPNTAWGAGKMDIKAAVDCVPGQGAPALDAIEMSQAEVPGQLPARGFFEYDEAWFENKT
jgi:subtilisin family serine protease